VVHNHLQTGGEGPKWNGTYKVTAKPAKGEWILEAAIPFATLNTTAPASGARWRANFRRKEIALGSSADWQVPIGYDPPRFGYLRFE
jgi:hypothetical protein